eukprot:2720282-Prymnesium_polylepis.1
MESHGFTGAFHASSPCMWHKRRRGASLGWAAVHQRGASPQLHHPSSPVAERKRTLPSQLDQPQEAVGDDDKGQRAVRALVQEAQVGAERPVREEGGRAGRRRNRREGHV